MNSDGATSARMMSEHMNGPTSAPAQMQVAALPPQSHVLQMPLAELAGPSAATLTLQQAQETTTTLTATSSAPAGSGPGAGGAGAYLSPLPPAMHAGSSIGNISMTSAGLMEATLPTASDMVLARAAAVVLGNAGSGGPPIAPQEKAAVAAAMTAEQVETLRRQICVYAIISQQLMAIYQAMAAQHIQMQGVLGTHQFGYDPASAAAAAAAAAVAAAAAAGLPGTGVGGLVMHGGTHTKARQRWTPHPAQLQILEEYFRLASGTPNKAKIKEITQELMKHGQISETNVYNWFQNRKARAKRKTTSHGMNGVEKDQDAEKETDGEDGDAEDPQEREKRVKMEIEESAKGSGEMANGPPLNGPADAKEGQGGRHAAAGAAAHTAGGEKPQAEQGGAGAHTAMETDQHPSVVIEEGQGQDRLLPDEGSGEASSQQPCVAPGPVGEVGYGQMRVGASGSVVAEAALGMGQGGQPQIPDAASESQIPMENQEEADTSVHQRTQQQTPRDAPGHHAPGQQVPGQQAPGQLDSMQEDLQQTPAETYAQVHQDQLMEQPAGLDGGGLGKHMGAPATVGHDRLSAEAGQQEAVQGPQESQQAPDQQQHQSHGDAGPTAEQHAMADASMLLPSPMGAASNSGRHSFSALYETDGATTSGGQAEGGAAEAGPADGNSAAVEEESTVQVLINGKPWDVPVTLLDVRNSFGANAVLMDANGDVVPTNEDGITLEPLQAGASYTVEGVDMAVIDDPSSLIPDSVLLHDSTLL